MARAVSKRVKVNGAEGQWEGSMELGDGAVGKDQLSWGRVTGGGLMG